MINGYFPQPQGIVPGGTYTPNVGATYQPSIQQPVDAVIRVNGQAGAEAYSLPPNSQAALFDENSDYFWFKKTDSGGYATLRKFSFVEETPARAQQIDTSKFATKEEVETLQKSLDEIKEMLK